MGTPVSLGSAGAISTLSSLVMTTTAAIVAGDLVVVALQHHKRARLRPCYTVYARCNPCYSRCAQSLLRWMTSYDHESPSHYFRDDMDGPAGL